jgi:hypothetical protein
MTTANGSGLSPRNRRAVAIVVAVAGTAVWLLTHRNIGLGVDGTVYALMALNWDHPGAYASDLFLRFGSQDQFSLFSPFYGVLIRLLRLGDAATALLLLTHALWLLGAWMLSHRLLRGAPAHLAFLLLVAIQPAYGGWAVLFAGGHEPTPRPMAEALVMIGLAFVFSRAWLRAAVAMALAAAIHPVMAPVGIAVAWMILAERRRVFLLALPAGVAAGLAMAALGLPPFDRLFAIMDPQWLRAVEARNGFVLTANWYPADWTRVAAGAALCLSAAVLSGGARRAFYLAVTLTAAAGLAISLIGGDLFHDVLVIQLQTWRAAWLMAVAALPAAALIGLRLRRHPLGPATTILLAAPLLVLTRPLQIFAFVWVASLLMSVAGLTLVILIRRGRAPRPSPLAARLIVYAAMILPLINVIAGLLGIIWDARFWLDHQILALEPGYFLLARVVILVLAIGLFMLARRRMALALVLASACLVLGGLTWDGRTPWQKYEVSGVAPPVALPAQATVLWGEDAGPAWLLLRRPAYVSASQSTGLLFSRRTALEWVARSRAVEPVLPMRDWAIDNRPAPCATTRGPLATAAVSMVCRRSLGLTGIVTNRSLAAGLGVRFQTPVPAIFSCTANRQVVIARSRAFTYVPCAAATGVTP